MAEPKEVGDLRQFLGLVNHLMKVSPNLAEKPKPVRELFRKENQCLGIGPSPTRSLPTPERRHSIQGSPRTVRSLKGGFSLIRRYQFWTGCCSHEETAIR